MSVSMARRLAEEWARKQREATAARDSWIVKMREEGSSLRDIARTVGLTAPTVDRIVRRVKAADS